MHSSHLHPSWHQRYGNHTLSVAVSTEAKLYICTVALCTVSSSVPGNLGIFFRNVLILLIAQDTVMNLLLKERRLKAELAVLGREKVSGERVN